MKNNNTVNNSSAGKGSRPRTFSQNYRDNYEKIFGKIKYFEKTKRDVSQDVPKVKYKNKKDLDLVLNKYPSIFTAGWRANKAGKSKKTSYSGEKRKVWIMGYEAYSQNKSLQDGYKYK